MLKHLREPTPTGIGQPGPLCPRRGTGRQSRHRSPAEIVPLGWRGATNVRVECEDRNRAGKRTASSLTASGFTVVTRLADWLSLRLRRRYDVMVLALRAGRGQVCRSKWASGWCRVARRSRSGPGAAERFSHGCSSLSASPSRLSGRRVLRRLWPALLAPPAPTPRPANSRAPLRRRARLWR
jgi:hypothetical protein